MTTPAISDSLTPDSALPPGLTMPLPGDAYVAPPLAPVRGLGNLGNTCYLNSAIQALRHIKPFADYIGGDTWRRWEHPDREGFPLLREAAAVTRALCEPVPYGAVVIPGNFVRAFIAFGSKRSDEIYFGAQADAAEALQILLDGIHTQLAREVQMVVRGDATTPQTAQYVKSLESWSGFFRREYSALLDMFYGQTQTRLTCERCGHISDCYEPWNMLKVPIPGADKEGSAAPTLNDCISTALASERLEDYVCSICTAAEVEMIRAEKMAAGAPVEEIEAILKRHASKGPALKEHAISRYPSNLILTIKRFTNLGQKVRARIPYEEDDINLAAWRAWPTLQASKDAHYRVCATVEHLGTCRGGHYIMRGRDPADGSWRIYDDARVSPSPIGGSAGPDTYILFLERKQ